MPVTGEQSAEPGTQYVRQTCLTSPTHWDRPECLSYPDGNRAASCGRAPGLA